MVSQRNCLHILWFTFSLRSKNKHFKEMWTGDAADLLRKVKFGRKALPPHLEQEVVCEIIDDTDSGRAV